MGPLHHTELRRFANPPFGSSLPFLSPLFREVTHRLGVRPRKELCLNGFTAAAVAVPLVSAAAGPAVLFTVRTAHVEQHKGEISFPGGRVDPGDRDTLAAALREAQEEVGICPADFRVLGALDDFLSVTGYRVTPHVVFLADAEYSFRPEPREVDEILLVPLGHLLNPAHREAFAHPSDGRPVPSYRWGPYRIWGLTAAILEGFLRVCFPAEEEP